MNREMLRAMSNEVEIFQLSKSFAFNNCFTGYNYTAIGLHIGNNTNNLQHHCIHILKCQRQSHNNGVLFVIVD